MSLHSHLWRLEKRQTHPGEQKRFCARKTLSPRVQPGWSQSAGPKGNPHARGLVSPPGRRTSSPSSSPRSRGKECVDHGTEVCALPLQPGGLAVVLGPAAVRVCVPPQ